MSLTTSTDRSPEERLETICLNAASAAAAGFSTFVIATWDQTPTGDQWTYAIAALAVWGVRVGGWLHARRSD